MTLMTTIPASIYRETHFADDVKLLYNAWWQSTGASPVCGDILRAIHNNTHKICLEYGWRTLDKNVSDAAVRLLDFSRDPSYFPTEGIRGTISDQQIDRLFGIETTE